MSATSKTEIKPYSKQELANLYKIGVRSISTWLKPFEKEIGKRNGRYYTPRQVKVIFDKLDFPSD